MQTRGGEVATSHCRTGRYFGISGEWFFSTRENLQIGPFSDRDDAEVELMFFLRHIQEGGIYPGQYLPKTAEVKKVYGESVDVK
ncbi:MAG: DUF6316 family protein [Pseudomonadales bacterium]